MLLGFFILVVLGDFGVHDHARCRVTGFRFLAIFCELPSVNCLPCPSLCFIVYLLLCDYIGVRVQVLLEFSAEALPDVL